MGKAAHRQRAHPAWGEEGAGWTRGHSRSRGGGAHSAGSAVFQQGVAMGGPMEMRPWILGRGMGEALSASEEIFP